MKSLFRFFLSTLLICVLFSCTQINGSNTGTVEFSVDDVLKTVYRAGTETINADGSMLEVSVKLTGGTSQEQSKNLKLKDIGTNMTVFQFNNVPVGGTIYIYVEVRRTGYRNNIIFDGQQTVTNITSGINDIGLHLKNRNRYLLWTYSEESMTDSTIYRLFDDLSVNFDSMTSLIGDLNIENTPEYFNFSFDDYGNMYTIETKLVNNDKVVTVKQYPYLAPENSQILYEYSYSANNRDIVYSVVASNGRSVFIGSSERDGFHLRKIENGNTAIELVHDQYATLTPLYIGIKRNGNFLVYFSSAYGVVKEYSKVGQVFEQTGLDFEILGLMPDGPDNFAPDYFRIVDVQLQGDYLYTLVQEKGRLESSTSDPFGGGVIPVDISGAVPVVKPIVGFDKNHVYKIVQEEIVTDRYFYKPVKFVNREKGKLNIADDGDYNLFKPGYTNVKRDVNRIVSLSINNSGIPAITNVFPIYGLTFDTECDPSETGKFFYNPPYVLHGVNEINPDGFYTVLRESDVLDNNPDPMPMISPANSKIEDWYIDENYNIYTLDIGIDCQSGSDIYMYPSNFSAPDNRPNWIYGLEEMEKASVGIKNIAVNVTNIYFDTGTYDPSKGISTYAINKIDYSKDIPQKELLFEIDMGIKTLIDGVTALEVDPNGAIYAAISYNILPETEGSATPAREIIKYSQNGTKEKVLKLTKNNTGIDPSRMVVSDMKIINGDLYIIVRSVDGIYSKGCVIPVKLSSFEPGVPVGLLAEDKAVNAPLDNSVPDFFYGPYKFVALKPDELVIADDGWYGDCENTNSVITMKLENGIPKFVSRKVLSDVTFSGEIDGSHNFM